MRDAELGPLADVEPVDALDSFERFFLRENRAVVGLATVRRPVADLGFCATSQLSVTSGRA